MWIYKGQGFIPGVPARDLTDAEMKEYKVEASDLYERVPASTKPPTHRGKSSRDRGDNTP